MKVDEMDVYVGIFCPELDEKYVFKCVKEDGSRLEGVMIYFGV